MVLIYILLGIVLFFCVLHSIMTSAAKEGTLQALYEYDKQKSHENKNQ